MRKVLARPRKQIFLSRETSFSKKFLALLSSDFREFGSFELSCSESKKVSNRILLIDPKANKKMIIKSNS